jgi:hypothetical protein
MVLLAASGCAASSSGGFAPTGTGDAGVDSSRDAAALVDSGEAMETSGPTDAAVSPDVTCAVPVAATGATSTRCTPDGPGAWACADASGAGWLYSCEDAAAGAHPQLSLVGGCSALGSYEYADASYAVALCASAACTAAAQYDAYCDAGSAVACPAASLDAGVTPGNGCVLSVIGGWSSGNGLPGPLYCCP